MKLTKKEFLSQCKRIDEKVKRDPQDKYVWSINGGEHFMFQNKKEAEDFYDNILPIIYPQQD